MIFKRREVEIDPTRPDSNVMLDEWEDCEEDEDDGVIITIRCEDRGESPEV